jgi:hypothetical protein
MLNVRDYIFAKFTEELQNNRNARNLEDLFGDVLRVTAKRGTISAKDF